MAIRLFCFACWAGVLAAGCADPSRSAEPGLYRLQSVAGQQLPYVPPPSLGFLGPVTAGDLLLRSDGRFVMGIAGMFGAEPGRYSTSGSTIRFLFDREQNGGGEARLEGSVAGGGITVRLEALPVLGPVLDMAFTRAALPHVSLAGSVFVLTALGGQPPPLSVDLGPGQVLRVRYDTLEFFDGAFFRQHRREDLVQRPGEPDSTYTAIERTVSGSFAGDATRLILRYYAPLTPPTMMDTLAITQGALVRAVGSLGPSETYSATPP